ncbi:SDR family NAD(P)-dependent oxidoreductase [Actinocrispum wychmicini]|uniref:Short-subunit dehydrogenase n=1 Tax=Actinocrispum wychmicini TaxID=1213861 RepID=A0A4R2JF70_9PSEU|nr:SDR family NAD(P)-dependent oxidoreductase [Actinocrispum wychmicini]TCO58373.1 short-subunit dehydrogenase [Actinocrispum wychmicini]
MGYYSGRVVVITGAGSGIGRALAVDLAGQGARLALSDQNTDAVAATVRRCEGAGAWVRGDTLDVTDRSAVLTYAQALAEESGPVDLVFAVAGVIHTGTVLDSEFEDIEHVINVNFWGVVNTVKAFLPHVIAAKRSGHVVIVSSVFGIVAAPHYSAYSASKFAVRGFTEALRQEMVLDGHEVAVTGVYPGGVRTSILRNGRFASREDASVIARTFDKKIARTEPEKAAEIILRGVRRRRAYVLVGMDARLVSAFIRVAGSAYQGLLPWGRRLSRWWR